MKKVLAIIGSYKKGETYKTLQLFEAKLREMGEVDFEYLWVKDQNLSLCKGCFLCLSKGEDFCSLKDDRDVIINKMLEADAVIFATPNYSLQVTAVMKNFLDRLAYVFHRPRFFKKLSMAIVTQGAYGAGKIVKYLEELTHFWGYTICPGLALTIIPGEHSEKENQIINDKVLEAVRRFYNMLISEKPPKPSFKDIMLFRIIRSTKPLAEHICPIDCEYSR